MITTDKDFDGLSDNGKPTTYYGSSSDTKPTDNIINGASFIEIDTSKLYFFNEDTKQWALWSGSGGGGSDSMLIINYDPETKTLDKTWQEINDAELAILLINTVDIPDYGIHADETFYKVISAAGPVPGSGSSVIYYMTAFLSLSTDGLTDPSKILDYRVFVAQTADDYPVETVLSNAGGET